MSGLWIMMEREFMARVARKAYWFMTLFGFVVMAGLTFMPALMQFIQHSVQTKIAIADPNRLLASDVARLTQMGNADYRIEFVPANEAKRLAESPAHLKDYFKTAHTPLVIVVKGSSTANASFVFEENDSVDPSTMAQVQTLLQQEVTAARIRQLEPTVQAELSRPVSFAVHQWNAQAQSSSQIIQSKLLVYFMVILLLMTVVVYGAWVVQGVIEEKTNRIVEMMLISLKPWQILFGKVTGLALLALMQYAIWTAGVLGARVVQESVTTIPLHDVPPATLAMLPVFFLLGYLMYASMFSIGGSLVHRSEEQQTVVTPVTLLLVLAFYASLVVLIKPNSTWAVIVSFIPLCTPIAMFARVALTHVPAWQVAVSIAGAMVVIWLLIWAGATVYKRYALHTSGQSGWKLLLGGKTAG